VAHNPFDVSDSRLCSVSTGIVADSDGISGDMAEEVGHTIMQDMDHKAFTDTVLRKSRQIRTLGDLNKTVERVML